MVSIKVSLHAFPPCSSRWPYPALGYLKGYVEKHNTNVQVRASYWNQSIIEKCLLEEKLQLPDHLSLKQTHLYRAIFANIYFLSQDERPETKEIIDFVEKWGSFFLSVSSIENFRRVVKKVKDFINDEVGKKEYHKDDIVGASTLLGQEIASITFLQGIKNRNPDVLTILGGMTQDDAKIILEAFPSIDICVIGEGERTLLKICEQYPSYDSLHEIGGIVYRKNDEIIINEEDPPIQEIDDIWADYEGFDWNISSTEGVIVFPIWDIRGCWWNRCEFCDLNKISPCFRERTPQSIIEEIKYHLYSLKGIQKTTILIQFLANDTRGKSNERFLFILKELKKLKNEYTKLQIFLELSPLYINDKIANYLNDLEASIQFGFEQWNRMVKVMNKAHQVEHGVQTLKLAEKYPLIMINGLNILAGFPGETISDVYETYQTLSKLKFILKTLMESNRLIGFSTQQIVVYPNSPLGKKWNFDEPIVREIQKNNPFTKVFASMCGNDELALSFFNLNDGFTSFDVTQTFLLTSQAKDIIVDDLGNIAISSYISSDNTFNLLISDQFGKKALELDDIDIIILKLTQEVISLSELQKQIPSLSSEEIEAILKVFEEQELVYSRGSCYINTLPSKIQQSINII